MVPYAPHSLEADGPSQLVLVIVKVLNRWSLRVDFSNSFFDYVDGLEGNYVKGLPRLTYGAHKSEHRGLAHDIDGTITGWPGSTIVPDRPFFTSSACEARPLWGNMSICPHTYGGLHVI